MRPAIHVWYKKFAYHLESVTNDEQPERSVVPTTDTTTAAVNSLIQCDQGNDLWISIRTIC